MTNTMTVTASNGASAVYTFSNISSAIKDGIVIASKLAAAGVETWRIVVRTTRGTLVREWSCA